MKKFRLLARRLSKKSADERILHLANLLFDDAEKSGRTIKSSVEGLNHLDIYHHDSGDFDVKNFSGEDTWTVSGQRAWK